MQESLFESESKQESRAPEFLELGEKLWALAKKGIYFGTSSWKYPEWKSMIYSTDYRSQKAFNDTCLREYSEIFPSVSGDFAFYNFPSEKMVHLMAMNTRQGFRAALKCTDTITLRRFPNLPRFGDRGGKLNPDFLNADLFIEKFLGAVEPIKNKLGPIILEFTQFPAAGNIGAFEHEDEFYELLSKFAAKLPRDYKYCYEIRTKNFVNAKSFARLEQAGATPALTSWTRVAPLPEQVRDFEKQDFPFALCRAILRPGKLHEVAEKQYAPYLRIHERVQPVRLAILDLVQWALKHRREAYILVNNHMEGCAPRTILELVEDIQGL